VHAGIGDRGAYLLFVGGLLYTVGALVYALKRPDPLPNIFGYHEIFHLLVIAAALCHFWVVRSLVFSYALQRSSG
jgi:hemolysin III